MSETPEANKPDFRNGFSIRGLSDGSMKLGHVDGEEVVLARRGDEFFAVGAQCTHYGGPLAEGLLVEHTVRCPWHHACSVSGIARRSGHRPWTQSLVGGWKDWVTRFLFVRSSHQRLPSVEQRAQARS